MIFKREELLIGKENFEKLKNSHVLVFGLGGVGGYVVEGLVRGGVGELTIVDYDTVDITNINRQIIATMQFFRLVTVVAIYPIIINIIKDFFI